MQEVVLNPNVEIVLGCCPSFTWEELEAVVALLEGSTSTSWEIGEAIHTSELPFSRINRIRRRHRRLVQRQEAATDSSVRTPQDELTHSISNLSVTSVEDVEDPEMLDLLLMSRGLGATDPRDKIYALLGLGSHDINPDYSMSPESVFTDFALQTIGEATSMATQREAAGIETSSHDREIRRALILLACAGRQNQALKLPSWVPDWTVALASRPLIFGFGRKFSAGGSKLGLFDWHYDYGLQMSGVLVDTVRVAGIVLLDADPATNADAHEMIQAWWLEAQQIAQQRIARSPGSTVYTDAFEAMRRRLAICKHGYYTGSNRLKRRGSLLDDAEIGADASHSTSQTLTLGPTRGRVAFATSTGFLGLAPHGTHEGDVVFVVRGADVPYVLRPQNDAYELIGEAYVEGLMRGQALEMEHLLPQDIMIR